MSAPNPLAAFAPPADSWQCKSCLVFNKKELSACLSCETDREPAAKKQRVAGGSGGAAPAIAFGVAPATAAGGAAAAAGAPAANALSKFAPAAGSWQCKSCLVFNPPSDADCKACETPRAGPKPGAAGGLFANMAPNAPAAAAISFGGAAAPAAGGGAPAVSFGWKPPAGTVTFGGGAAAAAAAPITFGSAPSAATSSANSSTSASSSSSSSSSSASKPAAAAKIAKRVAPVAGAGKTPTRTGALFVCGNGDCGQLGLGDDTFDAERFTPLPTPGCTTGGAFRAVSCGPLHSAAIDASGEVWTWGCNDDLALGRSGPEHTPAPVEWSAPAAAGAAAADGAAAAAAAAAIPAARPEIVAVTCGDCHTAFLTSDGRVLLCGTFKGTNGYIGHSANLEKSRVPLEVEGLPSSRRKGKRAVQIASGVNHLVVLLADGDVHVLGDGEQGVLGRIQRTRHRRTGLAACDRVVLPPRRRGAPGKVRATAVFAGEYHCFAVTADGDVYAWGLNNFGQLGLGHTEACVGAQLVEPLCGREVVQLAGGEHFSLALTARNEVFAFGRGDSGQLGGGVVRARDDAATRPVEITAMIARGIVRIACGGSFCAATGADGTLYTWGFGDQHQLGNAEEDDVPTPTAVPAPKGHPFAVLADGGAQHTAALFSKK
jgi:regulator of chromosome condensation